MSINLIEGQYKRMLSSAETFMLFSFQFASGILVISKRIFFIDYRPLLVLMLDYCRQIIGCFAANHTTYVTLHGVNKYRNLPYISPNVGTEMVQVRL